MKRVAVTGASGFIGRAVCEALAAAGCNVTAMVRRHEGSVFPEVERIVAADLAAAPEDSLLAQLDGVEMIVHLADNPERSDAHPRNLAIARAISRLSQAAGIRNAIFASSIYASYDERGGPHSYGAYKRASEAVLRSSPELTTVVLRLPPIYGPGGRGGVALLARLVNSGLPLPIGRAVAPRDYLSRANLAALIAALAILDHHGFSLLARTAWEPSDGYPLSTRELAQTMAAVMGRPARIFSAPPALVEAGAKLFGRKEQAQALFTPMLCTNSSILRLTAKWEPCTDPATNLAYLSAASPKP